ncbi:hypothetical protein GOODEAATRI_007156 [Goodea atripinnis]|uniref:Secreted protein n=1 Tax=Goodea atripinnis TaxID=208336 RepID=A0ABV0MPZ9_9TELE
MSFYSMIPVLSSLSLMWTNPSLCHLSVPLHVFALYVSSIHLTSSPLLLRLPVSQQHCNNHCIDDLGLDVGGVCWVVGGLGGRCQGDMGGGCHGNKQTLQVWVRGVS